MNNNTNLDLILLHNDRGGFDLWACRGVGKGCSRNKFRKTKAKCDDCIGPLPEDWTLQQVIDKINKGDA